MTATAKTRSKTSAKGSTTDVSPEAIQAEAEKRLTAWKERRKGMTPMTDRLKALQNQTEVTEENVAGEIMGFIFDGDIDGDEAVRRLNQLIPPEVRMMGLAFNPGPLQAAEEFVRFLAGPGAQQSGHRFVYTANIVLSGPGN